MADRILVFGEALLDDFGDQQVVGGAPFNVARNLTATGPDGFDGDACRQ